MARSCPVSYGLEPEPEGTILRRRVVVRGSENTVQGEMGERGGEGRGGKGAGAQGCAGVGKVGPFELDGRKARSFVRSFVGVQHC
jgi:hypothetical protein